MTSGIFQSLNSVVEEKISHTLPVRKDVLSLHSAQQQECEEKELVGLLNTSNNTKCSTSVY